VTISVNTTWSLPAMPTVINALEVDGADAAAVFLGDHGVEQARAQRSASRSGVSTSSTIWLSSPMRPLCVRRLAASDYQHDHRGGTAPSKRQQALRR